VLLFMTSTYYRRNMPHWQPRGASFFITCRLDGSLPRRALERIEANRRLVEREIAGRNETNDQLKTRYFKKLFALYDNLLDRPESGPLWLKNERVADVTEEAIVQRYKHLYKLWAYVVMANHIHVFLTPKPEDNDKTKYVRLEKITRLLKGYTSREANKILNRTGQAFWQDESFDHWSRDEGEFHRIIAYI
jgi:putative transposase